MAWPAWDTPIAFDSTPEDTADAAVRWLRQGT